MSLQPATFNITAVKGSTWSNTFTIPDNFPISDLAACTAVLTVRQYPNEDYLAAITLTDTDGIVLTDTYFQIVFSDTDTDITAQTYEYDFFLTDGTDSYAILRGKFIVLPSATNV